MRAVENYALQAATGSGYGATARRTMDKNPCPRQSSMMQPTSQHGVHPVELARHRPTHGHPARSEAEVSGVENKFRREDQKMKKHRKDLDRPAAGRRQREVPT